MNNRKGPSLTGEMLAKYKSHLLLYNAEFNGVPSRSFRVKRALSLKYPDRKFVISGPQRHSLFEVKRDIKAFCKGSNVLHCVAGNSDEGWRLIMEKVQPDYCI